MRTTTAILLILLTISCNSDETNNKKTLIDSSKSFVPNIVRDDTSKSLLEKPKMTPTEYTVLRKKEGTIDILVNPTCTKENIRWIVRQVLDANDNNRSCSVDVWTSKSAYKKYSDFYDDEDKVYDHANGVDDFRKRMTKNGKDVKQRIQETEEIRIKNVLASYGGGYITFLPDDSQESF